MRLKEWFIIWFKAARAPFLVVSFIPCILGGIIAYYHFPQTFDWFVFILVTIGIVSAHSAADFIDDYFDFKTGNLGNKEKQFHDSPLIDGKVTLRKVLIATIIFLTIAIGIGIFLLFKVGMPVIIMMAIGAFIVLFYTAPPIKLNYRGIGETMLFIAFGPLTVFGVYFVLTNNFSIEPIIISLPLGIFTMNVGLVSNIFDYFDDISSNKKSIPVRFGQLLATKILTIVIFIAFASIITVVILGLTPVWTLIGLLPMPLAYQVVKATRNYEDNNNYTRAMTKAIALTSITGILLCFSYGIEILI
jgi:1,4-dihydroxy-2-naphthoate octaprenyltransferase